jgi:alkylation response protein AidB-like acyl-CoA dehydrogenase
MDQALSMVDEALPGGGFLVAPVPRSGIMIREDATEEQELFIETAQRFVEEQIWTQIEAIEKKANVEGDDSTPLVVKLTRDAAELGFTSLEIPEEYEGLGLDLTTSLMVSETLAGCASFAVTLGAHAGIGTLPIVYFGNAEQKAKYLPKLAEAELFSCYALTEPGNGSDALNGRTTAARSEDGTHFVLNGQKQFITNGSWADLAVVFANIDGKYSGLIVDLHSEGVQRGAEEKKMGIMGSSTTALVFQDVKVPLENQLGTTGAGPNIALNILGVGRLKLGFSCLGTAKYAVDLTLKFMKDRKQFGRPIVEFDLQQGKLAETAAWIYGCDSLCYRVAGQINTVMHDLPEGHTAEDEMAVLRRFGVECAMVKVSGSETLSKVAYHAIRMHGGYGFCEEYQVERLARDNVVDTIFEGTNDINRLVLAGGLVESAFMGSIPFLEFLDTVHDRVAADFPTEDAEGYLGAEVLRVNAIKRAVAFATERVLLNVGKDIRNEQQVMMFLSDAMIALGTAEATVARTIQVGAEHPQAKARVAATRLILNDAEDEVARLARACVQHVSPSNELTEHRQVLDGLLSRTDEDVIALKRILAEHVTAAGRYDLG